MNVRIESVSLPEFGLDVSWAMCRNPMCANFGIPFEGEIPGGRKRASDERYSVLLTLGRYGQPVATIRCKGCGQNARLASNAAVRPIARYFLSLSFPFTDCPNDRCRNHGVNLYEHWPLAGKGRSPYRTTREHVARCNRCGGHAAGSEERGSSISLGTPRRVVDRPETLDRWRALLTALPAARSIAEITQILGVSYEGCYRDLARLGARLSDYHAFRNAHLLHPDTPSRERPISLHTDVIQLSARHSGQRNSARPLAVIVTVASAGDSNFVLAAHPCFLPATLGPGAATLEGDGRRLAPEREWDALRHPFGEGLDRPPDKREDASLAHRTPDGYMIPLPYAALAHFLVVQKLLSRFRAIHNTIDADADLFPAALVAYRDRILAGRPEAGGPVVRPLQAVRTAEVALYSVDRRVGRQQPASSGLPDARSYKSPDDAWWAAEKRFANLPVPAHLEKAGLSRGHPRVRATLFRHAFKGAFSKAGSWAWLEHPPETPSYVRPRTLWLTRTPHKTFAQHGRAVLEQASLQPLDAVFNEIRENVRSARRPSMRAGRNGGSPGRASVLMNELAIYLLLRNYGLRGTSQPPDATSPAKAMGLGNKDREDPADIAWHFRLGIEHARQISNWCRG